MDINKFIVDGGTSVLDTLKLLNNVAYICNCLYVIDDKKRLLGSVTDGDIRRGLIRNIDLSDSVKSIMMNTPKFVFDYELLKMDSSAFMKEHGLESLPIVNSNYKVVNVVFLENGIKKDIFEYKNNKVFLLAGGEGHRLKPFTKILPKPLIPLGDTPIIEVIMDDFLRYGFGEFVISLNYKGDIIKSYFSDVEVASKYRKIEFLTESKPLGTVGSLSLANNVLDDTFFIANADTVIKEDLSKLLDYHKKENAALTILGCLKEIVVPYGVINMDDNQQFLSITEKPSYKNIISSGYYVAEPLILRHLIHNEYLDMPTLIRVLHENDLKISVYPIMEDQWFDVGQWTEYERIVKHFGQ